MNKKDIMEIKRRYTKEGCTFTKLCGCYVNSSKEKILLLERISLTLRMMNFLNILKLQRKPYQEN